MASCTVDDIITLLRRGGRSETYKKEAPFEIEANQFRDFAIEDTKIDTVHQRVNAISNVKRAIECRIDELLYAFCLHIKSENEKWNFPKKIQVLGDLGVFAPRILQKINRKRNQLEHQYVKPTQEDVKDALDVATLFIGYTDRLLHYPNFMLMEIKWELKNSMTINRKRGIIVIKEDDSVRKVKIGDEDGWLEVAKIIARPISKF